MSAKRFLSRRIKKISGTEVQAVPDYLALEEPLEIRVAYGPEGARQWKTVAITMRTPGHDRELAAGFLVGEGLLRSLDQIEAVHQRGPRYGEEGWRHSVRVTLRPGVEPDLARLERNFYTTSSCGVCGKTSLEALEMNIFPPLPAMSWQIDAAIISALPARLREAQAIFERTGGLHAAGLFTPEGRAVVVREDVGRHNAVDKVVGAQFLAGHVPLSDYLLVVSGRASFELMQKALAAGIPMLVAVGAPSSLAVEVAEKFGAALIGFTKAGGFNIYTGGERVRLGAGEPALPGPS
ncbi:MAG: formate dehydrogenase accessory sulfurtransferase FdhD [Methylacidiphilales bacterium]|nr:formate dehydrogenase accessory sulfurtransferase FdhD [Candidatus Methylacidiphilales bacterium]